MQDRNRFFNLKLSDYVNVAMLVLAIASLIIAIRANNISIAAYKDSQRSGVESNKILTASRDALTTSVKLARSQERTLESARAEQTRLLRAASSSLENVVRTANDQQAVLQRSLAISSKQLALYKAQYKAQIALQQARPRIEALVGEPFWNKGDKNIPMKGCRLRLGNGSVGQTSLGVRNFGNAAMTNSTVYITTLPPLEIRSPLTWTQIQPSSLQFNSATLVPFVPYFFPLSIVPNGQQHVLVLVQVYGQNAVPSPVPVPEFGAAFDCVFVKPLGPGPEAR